ncbi:hypothetical protein LCGC14_2524620, partial [marine sediment metagenome]
MPRSKYGKKGTVKKVDVKLKKTFSPAAKLHKALGDEGYAAHMGGIQRRVARQKRIDALDPIPHNPN